MQIDTTTTERINALLTISDMLADEYQMLTLKAYAGEAFGALLANKAATRYTLEDLLDDAAKAASDYIGGPDRWSADAYEEACALLNILEND